MPTFRAHGRRGACTAAAILLTGTALSVLLSGLTGPAPPPAAPDSARAGTAGAHRQPPAARTSPPTTAVMPRSQPVRISIDKIDLNAGIEAVSLADNGTVSMPADPARAGWYTGSATPGENGNSILVGHLDTAKGPAAFYGLGALREGDRVHLTRRDGTTTAYSIDDMTVWPKTDLPRSVYAPTLHSRLTLITCADWDPRARTYRSNLVITAHR